MQQKVQALEKKLDRVLFYFDDDKGTGRKGLVHELKDLSERLEKIEEHNKIIAAKVSVFGAVGGGLVIGLWKGLSFFWK